MDGLICSVTCHSAPHVSTAAALWHFRRHPSASGPPPSPLFLRFVLDTWILLAPSLSSPRRPSLPMPRPCVAFNGLQLLLLFSCPRAMVVRDLSSWLHPPPFSCNLSSHLQFLASWPPSFGHAPGLSPLLHPILTVPHRDGRSPALHACPRGLWASSTRKLSFAEFYVSLLKRLWALTPTRGITGSALHG